MRINRLKPIFVADIPDMLEPGILYLALEYDAMAHMCACGCGNEVATPISPTDWRITWNGVDLTVRPSIGNGSLQCRSHYLIEAGRIKWCAQMSDHEIVAERARTAKAKRLLPNPIASEPDSRIVPEAVTPHDAQAAWIVRFWRLIFGR